MVSADAPMDFVGEDLVQQCFSRYRCTSGLDLFCLV